MRNQVGGAKTMAELQQVVALGWTSVLVGSRPCLLRGAFGGEGYEVSLWDAGEMMTERLGEEEVAERMAALNPNVEAPVALVLSRLSSLLQSDLASYSKAGEGKTLLVSGYLSGLQFTWQFHFSPAPRSAVELQLVQPLLTCASELFRQRLELVGIIRRKDQEIQDYKDGGAVLSRRHLETAPFDVTAFNDRMALCQEFEASVSKPYQIVANDYFQNLFQNAAMLKAQEVTHAKPSTASESPQPSISSPELPSVPAKPTAPVKDEELGRREALQRKLEEERLRGKKKKKRLM